MPTVPRKVAKHNSPADRIHHLLMDFVRASGLLQPDMLVPGYQLSLSQAFALHELDTGTPLSQRDLGERLRLEKSSVSRMAAEMERQGLLVRERDPANRRLYRLRLTDKGRAAHAEMRGAFHEQYERWIGTMTRAETDALLVGLPALVRAVHAVSGASAAGPPR
jgi:DNA-binding MarR family transcriptional regulator